MPGTKQSDTLASLSLAYYPLSRLEETVGERAILSFISPSPAEPGNVDPTCINPSLFTAGCPFLGEMVGVRPHLEGNTPYE